jgi:hypothetical protein
MVDGRWCFILGLRCPQQREFVRFFGGDVNTVSLVHPFHPADAANLSESESGSSHRLERRESTAAPDAATDRGRKALWIPLAMWAVLLVGLLLQLFSPHLQIAHNSFVIPPELVRQGMPLDPRALVQQERMIQLCSALLVLTGASGLGLYYRRILLKYASGKS